MPIAVGVGYQAAMSVRVAMYRDHGLHAKSDQPVSPGINVKPVPRRHDLYRLSRSDFCMPLRRRSLTITVVSVCNRITA